MVALDGTIAFRPRLVVSKFLTIPLSEWTHPSYLSRDLALYYLRDGPP